MLGMACRVCVFAILGALAATPAFAVGIATITDVVNDGFRKPPGDKERLAAPSDELVSDEALRTNRNSSIAVRFVDGSELSLEAQSEVVLSDYVFDPQAAASTGVINLNVGLFHFNSNEIPDGGLTLKTPVATIGVRGTDYEAYVCDPGVCDAVTPSGEVVSEGLSMGVNAGGIEVNTPQGKYELAAGQYGFVKANGKFDRLLQPPTVIGADPLPEPAQCDVPEVLQKPRWR